MEEKIVQIPEDLLKRLIKILWFTDPDLDDVTELSKDLIYEYPEMFVDIMEEDEYKGTRPSWLDEHDEYMNTTNLIYAPQEEEGDESDD